MRKFINYIAILFATIFLIMAVLDLVYTSVYEYSNPRNKFQYILNLKPQKINYIFLGSSRTANSIVTSEVIKTSGLKAINLGMEGAQLDDNLLQLKLLLDKGVVADKIFLQVDYQFENLKKSSIAKADAIPFIHNRIIKEHLEKEIEDFSTMYYIPFYRYMVNDYKIGFREFFFSIINKKPKIDLNDGFTPKKESRDLKEQILPNSIASRNLTIEKMQRLCDEKNIELVYFCAPFCSKVKNIEYVKKLKAKLPGLQDYSSAFKDSLFFDCGHLNDRGALLFTKLFIVKNKL